MKRLKLYYLENDYIEYLRKFDKKVRYNKGSSRPYIGVVLEHNGYEYFAPLASPKKKHEFMSKKTLDIFKIKDGKLGIININNMIPTPKNCLNELLPSINDIVYKKLLEEQISFLNNNRL